MSPPCAPLRWRASRQLHYGDLIDHHQSSPSRAPEFEVVRTHSLEHAFGGDATSCDHLDRLETVLGIEQPIAEDRRSAGERRRCLLLGLEDPIEASLESVTDAAQVGVVFRL